MADTAVALQSNGLLESPKKVTARVECLKILTLRDEVFAGTHPRLTVPTKISEEVTKPQVAALKSTSTAPLSNGVDTTTAAVQAPSSPSNAYSRSAATPVSLPNVPSQKSSFASKLPSSGNGPSTLDPIFLTKSDDLVKAEIRLERQRIERSLEEQVKKLKGSKFKFSELDTTPDFDVSEVFFLAQERVKHLAPNEEISGINGTVASSDSFDENTFYSSQHNESGEEVDEPPKRRKTKPCTYFFRNGACKHGDACTYSHDPAFKKQLQGKPPTKPATKAEATNKRPNPKANGKIEKPVPKRPQMLVEEDREHESFISPKEIISSGRNESMDVAGYSPPEAPTSISQRDSHYKVQTIQNQPTREDYDHPEQLHSRDLQLVHNDDESPPTSNGKDVRVVRNHITSPIAPQPARVSPLAIAKQPRLAQLQQDDRSHTDIPRSSRRADSVHSRPAQLQQEEQLGKYGGVPQTSNRADSMLASPTSSILHVNSRKRRRDPDPQEARRNVTARRYIESPDPYIKEEPMSPPPFGHSSTARQIRHEPQRREPVIVDTISPNPGDRVVYQSRNANSNRPADIVELRGTLTTAQPRIASGTSERYDFQEEPNLRRIVSAQQPQRIQSPFQEYSQYPVTHNSSRAMSHSYIVQPDADSTHNHRASVQPQVVRRVQRDRSLSPQLQPIQYISSGRETTSMAPPPRRIVMDQYGNKYYEATVPVERKVSVAPVSRYMSDAPTSYEQTRKVSSQVYIADQYDGQGYGQEYSQRVASPVPTSPRYVEYYPTNETSRVENRPGVYQPREEAYSDRSGVARMVEYGEDRTPRQFEQVLRPRETISRMQSVQPPMQYEVIRERVPRTHSVRPDHHRIVSLGNRQEMEPPYARQVSIRPDERYVRAPSYAAPEKPRYQYVSEIPDGRFARKEVQDGMVIDGVRNIGPRQVQRM